MLIGVTGPICAGKTEFTRILADDFGFSRLLFGDEVRLEARKLGIDLTRKNLQFLGNARTTEHGGDYWVKRLIAKTEKDRPYALEGIRNPEEIDYFNKRNDFTLVGITAPYELRLNRYLSIRKREEDPLTKEDFARIDALDRGSEKGGQRSGDCYKRIDKEIVNDSSIEELMRQTHTLVRDLASVAL